MLRGTQNFIKYCSFYLTLLLAFQVLGCTGLGIKEVNVVKTAPPYTGDLEVKIAPYASGGQLLFTMIVEAAEGIYDKKLYDEVKQKSKSLGANVIVLECGAPGTTQSTKCVVRGFLE